MTNDQIPRGYQFETPFDHIKDVNEFVLAARAYWAERNEAPAGEELLDDDAAMDYLSGCVAGWIVLREQVPIDSKERVTQIFGVSAETVMSFRGASGCDWLGVGEKVGSRTREVK